MGINFIVVLCFCISSITLFAQEYDTLEVIEYDTIYTIDTLIKTVEIIEYEYEDVAPVSLHFGLGFAYQTTSISSDIFDKQILGFSIPLALRISKNNFFIQSGFASTSIAFDLHRTDSIQYLTSHEITETIVIDTIYKNNGGTIVPIVFTKEVVRTQTDTSYSDTVITASHNYSLFQIPLMVGYSYQKYSLSTHVATGVGFNFFYSEARNSLQRYFPGYDLYAISYLLEVAFAYQFSERFSTECAFYGSWLINHNQLNINTTGVSMKLFYKIF